MSSWSITMHGRAAAVKTKLEEYFGSISLAEPERSIAGLLCDAASKSLGAMPADVAVRVEGYGSQSPGQKGTANNFKLEVVPLYGFVE